MTFEKLPVRLQQLQNRLKDLRHKEELFLQNGDQGYASAPSNIALFKYWGKEQDALQIPSNSSVSVTLDACRTHTRVSVSGRFVPADFKMPYELPDQIYFAASLKEVQTPLQNFTFSSVTSKLKNNLSLLRQGWADEIAFSIVTFNDFPTGCGLASSASGMAALVGAIADVLQLNKRFGIQDAQYWMSEWSRILSGSATRSSLLNPHPLVAWEKMSRTQTQTISIESSLNLKHCVCVLSDQHKSVGSSDGHGRARTSPLFSLRDSSAEQKYKNLKKALTENNFSTVTQETEQDAFAMHAVMMTSEPSLRYFMPETERLISEFVRWRDSQNIQALWTLDAGPNVHLLFLEQEEARIKQFLDVHQQTAKPFKIIFGIKNSSRACCRLELEEGPA